MLEVAAMTSTLAYYGAIAAVKSFMVQALPFQSFKTSLFVTDTAAK
jgi:hypothetical protein